MTNRMERRGFLAALAGLVTLPAWMKRAKPPATDAYVTAAQADVFLRDLEPDLVWRHSFKVVKRPEWL